MDMTGDDESPANGKLTLFFCRYEFSDLYRQFFYICSIEYAPSLSSLPLHSTVHP